MAIILSFTVVSDVSKITASYLVEQQVQQEKEKDLLDEGKVEKPFEESEQTVTDVIVAVSPQIMLFDIGCIVLLIPTLLVSSLGYSQYLQFLIGKYMDLAQADEEREEREHEIYLEYPEFYEDEGILEEEKWLEEFLNQLPEKKKEHFKQLIEENNNY